MHDRRGSAAAQAGRRVDQRLQRHQPPWPRPVDLEDRGFKIAAVGNDPQDKTIKDVAHIRYGPAGEESAKLLAQHIKGAKLIQDKRKDDTIDLALGTTWKGFGPIPTPTTQAASLPPCPTITVEG